MFSEKAERDDRGLQPWCRRPIAEERLVGPVGPDAELSLAASDRDEGKRGGQREPLSGRAPRREIPASASPIAADGRPLSSLSPGPGLLGEPIPHEG